VFAHSGIQGSGLDVAFAQVGYLVLHQGDEWRNDDAQSVEGEAGYLETDGLAAAGGQQGQGVATVHHRQDNVFLQWPETVVTPVVFQYFMYLFLLGHSLMLIKMQSYTKNACYRNTFQVNVFLI